MVSLMKMKVLLVSMILFSFSWSLWADEDGGTLYPIEENGKWGYIDQNGIIVIKPQYDGAKFFCGKLARIIVQTKVGFIDREGKIVIKPIFKDAHNFSTGGVAPVAVDASYDINPVFQYLLRILGLGGSSEKWGFINSSGKYVIEPKFDYCGYFEMDEIETAIVESNQKYGYIDKDGSVLIQPQFARAEDFNEGLAPAAVGSFFFGKWGYIDKTGKFLLEPIYDMVGLFNDGMGAVNKGYSPPNRTGKFGFVDKTGKLAIPIRYDGCWWFTEGLAAVLKDGKWGYIDKLGQYIIKPVFEEAYPFTHGIAIVKLSGLFAGIDKNGNILFKIKAEELESFYVKQMARIKVAGKYGLIDQKGRIVVKPEYDELEITSSELIRVKLGEKWGYINYEGKKIWMTGAEPRASTHTPAAAAKTRNSPPSPTPLATRRPSIMME